MKQPLLVKHPKHYHHFTRRAAVQFIIIFVAGTILVPQLNELFENRQLLGELSMKWIALSILSFFLTYVAAALVYQNLSFRPLKLFRNILVQIATGFTNRLLPSGIGGIGTNVLFLSRSGFSRPAAIALSIANNLLGFIAFFCILLLAGVLSPSFIGDIFSGISPQILWGSIAALLILAISTLFIRRVRRMVSYNARQAGVVLKSVAARPIKLLLAFLSSIGITLLTIATLYCCLKSAGISLDISDLVFVFGAGALAISVSPSPGGLGIAEVGLVLALGQIGQESAHAVAAVAAYRIISFWLPILPGYLAFRIISARRYI